MPYNRPYGLFDRSGMDTSLMGDPYSPAASRYPAQLPSAGYPTPAPSAPPSLTGMIMGTQNPTPLSDSASGMMSMIPGWGWVAGAAMAGKKMAKDMNSPMGDAADALFLPSIEEHMADPIRSGANTLDPLGVAVERGTGIPGWAISPAAAVGGK